MPPLYQLHPSATSVKPNPRLHNLSPPHTHTHTHMIIQTHAVYLGFGLLLMPYYSTQKYGAALSLVWVTMRTRPVVALPILYSYAVCATPIRSYQYHLNLIDGEHAAAIRCEARILRSIALHLPRSRIWACHGCKISSIVVVCAQQGKKKETWVRLQAVAVNTRRRAGLDCHARAFGAATIKRSKALRTARAVKGRLALLMPRFFFKRFFVLWYIIYNI